MEKFERRVDSLNPNPAAAGSFDPFPTHWPGKFDDASPQATGDAEATPWCVSRSREQFAIPIQ